MLEDHTLSTFSKEIADVVARGYSVFADTYINTVFVEAECWAECVASRNASAKVQSQG
jgi:hypothetical protein